MSPGSKLLIQNSTFNFHQEFGIYSALQIIFSYSSGTAFQNSDDEYNDAKCRAGTRTSLLDAFEDWAVGQNTVDRPIISWVHGPAGTGKTAIARSLADRCSKLGKLAASFFFWRTNEERTDEKKVVPTLAYQLALSIPPLSRFIEAQVQQNPASLCQSPTGQMHSLLLIPLECMISEHPDFDASLFPSLIVIDGLDECGGMRDDRVETQGRVMDALRALAGQPHYPFRIFITSRAEVHIFRFFRFSNMHGVSHQPVDLSKPYHGMQDDVRTFVTDDFNWIKRYHRHKHTLPHNWPGIEVINIIVERSSGQFLYAATVMKYIRSQSHLPAVRLKVVMGDHNPKQAANPFTDLDSLYKHVITSATEPETALLLIAFEQVHPPNGQPIALEILERGLSLDRGAVLQSLTDFQPLLGTLETPTQLIRFHHDSFLDFLFDKARAGEWHIDIGIEAERFAILDLKAFEMAGSREDAAFWLQSFCDALRKATPTETLKETLASTWLDLTSYGPGQHFLRESGLAANTPLFYVQSAISSSSFPVTERHTITKDFVNSLLSLLDEYIQPYRSHPLLYALFLLHVSYGPYNLPGWHLSDWDMHLLGNIFDQKIISCPELFQIDHDSLILVNPERGKGETPHRTSWLHALLRHVSYFKIYVPPNDALLVAATQILLQSITGVEVHRHLDRDRVASFVGWLLHNQSPSNTILSHLDHPCMSLKLKHELWNNKDVQGYINRSGLRAGLSTTTIVSRLSVPERQSAFENLAKWTPVPGRHDEQPLHENTPLQLGKRRHDAPGESLFSTKKLRLDERAGQVADSGETTEGSGWDVGQREDSKRPGIFELGFDEFYLDWAERIVSIKTDGNQ
ncbi:hypothetical protein BJ165DRAFT_1529364 [Panaeolus papilionaceus]|nr:hypothetical protein BJ165DRAFT_1529364 [Panaeolus papilionaceus]